MKHIGVLISLSSFLFAFFTFEQTTHTYLYTYVWLLPFFYGIISIVFFKVINNCLKNLIYAIIVSGYYIRNVLSIYIFAVSDFQSVIKPTLESSVYSGIILMTFEVFVVFSYLNYKLKGIHKNAENIILQPSKSLSLRLKIVIILIIFTLTYMWMSVPAISDNYLSLADQEMSYFSTKELNESVVHGSIDRLFLTTFLTFFSIFRIIFPIFIFSSIRRRIGENVFSIILCIFIISLQLFFITSQTMIAFMVVCVLLWTLKKLYPRKSSLILSTSIGIILLVLLLIIVGKSDDSGSNLSMLLQSYFPGISCVAAAFEIPDYPKLLCFLQDIYVCIPFRYSIFPYEFGVKTVEVFNNANGVTGQIIPFVSELYLYCGFISPILLLIIVAGALYYYKKATNSKTVLHYTTYLFTACYLAMSLSMYHITIVGAAYIGTCIPLIIVTSLFEKYQSRLKIYE